MPNLTSGQNQILITPWDTQPQMRLPSATPAASNLTFYTSQAVMRDINGNVIQCDDTVKGEFIGFVMRIINQTAFTTDTIQQNGIQGDTVIEEITQPQRYMAQMASVAAGQEGQKVYWQFNNQVQFTSGNNGNFAGTVWQIFDSTHAWIMPPWLNRGIGDFGYMSHMLYSTPAAITLTKWDVERIIQTATLVPQAFTLPSAALCSPGDNIVFLYSGATTQQVTLATQGGQTINGAATYAMATAQYSKTEVETDGAQWYVLR